MRPDETEFSPADRKSLCDLDLALNHFEFVLHLEEQCQIDSEDRRALFGYWYEWLSKPDRAEIRRYIREYGYAALARLLTKIQADRFSRCVGQLVAFYGTLRDGCGGGEEALLKKGMNSLGTCRIHGKLIDLGSWPGLMEGEGIVKGDLYEMVEGDFAGIDEHEGNDFRRRRVRLVDPEANAWVYFYVGEDSGPLLPGGDWMNRRQQTTP